MVFPSVSEWAPYVVAFLFACVAFTAACLVSRCYVRRRLQQITEERKIEADLHARKQQELIVEHDKQVAAYQHQIEMLEKTHRYELELAKKEHEKALLQKEFESERRLLFVLQAMGSGHAQKASPSAQSTSESVQTARPMNEKLREHLAL